MDSPAPSYQFVATGHGFTHPYKSISKDGRACDPLLQIIFQNIKKLEQNTQKQKK